MARKPLAAAATARFEANTEGRDIVGLQPNRVVTPKGLPVEYNPTSVDSLIDAVATAAADRGFSPSATRAFLRGIAPIYPKPLMLAKTREAAESLGYTFAVQP